MTKGNFEIKPDGLYLSNGRFVANFVPSVRFITELKDGAQIEESGEAAVVSYRITVEFKCFSGDKSAASSVHVEDLSLDKLDKIDPTAIHPSLYAELRKEVVNFIKLQLPDAAIKEKYLIRRCGWTSVNGTYVFAMGNSLIGNTDVDFEFIHEKYTFQIDENISKDDASENFWNLLNSCTKDNHGLDLVILYLMGAYIRQPLKDAGYFPNTVMWLSGGSQSGKTTFTKKIACHILNENMCAGNYTRVASTAAAVEKSIEFYKDLPFIYDDLYYDDKKIMRQIEERVKLLLRSQADGVIREKMGSAPHKINAQLFIIGEYLIDGISNIGRLIHIRLKKPINSTLLTTVAKSEKYIESFTFYYIRWIAYNYTDIVDYIRRMIQFHRESFQGETSRNYDKFIYTHIITNVFFKFYRENTGDNPGNDNIDKFEKKLNENWDRLLEQNHAFFEKKSSEEQMRHYPNYSRILHSAIQTQIISPGKKGSDFFNASYKKHDCYYIRCDYLRQLIFKMSDLEVSSKALTEYFRLREIGLFGSDGRVIQYKKNQKRYLVLKISELKSDANRDK